MKTIPKRIRPKVVPKLSIGGIISNTTTGAIGGSMAGPVGTVVGGLAGFGTGLMSHLGEQNSLKQQEAARLELIRRNKNITDAARFAEFNTNGYAMNNYYSKGGTPKLKSGGTPATKKVPYKLQKAGKVKLNLNKPIPTELNLQGDTIYTDPIETLQRMNISYLGKDSANFFKRVPTDGSIWDKLFNEAGKEEIPKLEKGGLVKGKPLKKKTTVSTPAPLLDSKKPIKPTVNKHKDFTDMVLSNGENVLKSVAHIPRSVNEIADAVYSLAYTGYSPFSKKHWEVIGNKIKDAAVTSQEELDSNYNPATIIDNTGRAVINVQGGKMASKVAGKVLQTPVAQKIIKGVSKPIDDVIKYYLPKKGFDPKTLKTIPQGVDAPLRPNSYSYTPAKIKSLKPESIKKAVSKPVQTKPAQPKNNSIYTTSPSQTIVPEGMRLPQQAGEVPITKTGKLHTRTISGTPRKIIREVRPESVKVKETWRQPNESFKIPNKNTSPDLPNPKVITRTKSPKLLPSHETKLLSRNAPKQLKEGSNVIYQEGRVIPESRRLPANQLRGEMINKDAAIFKNRGVEEINRFSNSENAKLYKKLYQYHADYSRKFPQRTTTFEEWLKMLEGSKSLRKEVSRLMGMDIPNLTPIKPKSLAKGGTVSMSGIIPGIKTDATEIPIAPNAIQVKTNKKGTDKIKANLQGSLAMVDNNELIVNMSDGTPVVISDDLGEVDKYKSLLKKGYNPNKLNDVFGRRAIARQTSNNKLDGGGTPYPYYKNGLLIGQFTDEQAKKLGLSQGESVQDKIYDPANYKSKDQLIKEGKTPITNKPVTSNTPTEISPYKTFKTRPYNDPYDWTKPGATLEKQASSGAGLYGGITPEDVLAKGNPEILKAVFGENMPDASSWTANNTSQLVNYINNNYANQLNKKDSMYGHDYHSILTNPTAPPINLLNPVDSKLKINKEDISTKSLNPNPSIGVTKPSNTEGEYKIYEPPTKEPFLNNEDRLNFGLAAAQTLGNVVSMFEAQNQKVPKPVLNTAITEDVFKNRPIFEQQKSTLKGMEVAARNNIKLNSSNANSYIARMSNLIPTIQSGMGQLSSQEAADRNAIYDRNNRALNTTAMQNNSIINNYQNANFAKNLDDIQNRNTVMTNAIGSVQGVLDNKKARDMETMGLQALAKSYGIEWNGDPEDMRKQMIDKLINGHLG